MNFGARLKAVADCVPVSHTMVDVGTDHAYLPVLLWQQGKLQKAVAGDIVPGPCEAARKTVHSFHLETVIEVRQGSGLTVVSPGEVQTIVMAGMGAETMLQILKDSPEVWQQADALVLQPMSDSARLRHWAEQQGWAIDKEELVEEAGRIYEILRLVPCPGYTYPGPCYEVGQLLIDQHHPLLLPFVTHMLEKYRQLLGQMDRSPRARTSVQYKKFQNLTEQLEGIVRGNND